MASPLKDLVTTLRRQGVEVTHGGSHIKLTYNRRLVGILPSNLKLDDRTTYRRTCSQLRRAGLTV
jgi:hypothetical protein